MVDKSYFVKFLDEKGGKCENCGSYETVMADSGKGWGCQDCGHFTEKR